MKAKLETFRKQFDGESLSYCPPDYKAKFHRNGKTLLRALAKELGLEEGSFEIRSNMGGIAVSGEITLHAENIYVQLSQVSFPKDAIAFLVRSCKGRRDYTGGPNNFVSLALASELLLPLCKRILDNSLTA